MRCNHNNITITEHILSKYTYTILDGHLAGTYSSGAPTPRVFDVNCQDCGMQKTYRYGPGEFGPQSSPAWLYDYIEQVVCKNRRARPAPERRKKA